MTPIKALKKIFLLSVFSLFATGSAFAQCGPMMADPCPPAATEVPIDGGLFGLLILGAAYGAKKIHDQRKKQQQ